MRLVFLFVLAPALELAILIELGRRIGTLPTLGVIAATGVLGALLARRQGLAVLRRMRQMIAAGQIPASSIADGVLILIAGALLITPGVLTDVLGFLCLIPGSREAIKKMLWERVVSAVREGRVHVSVNLDVQAAHDRGGPRDAPRPVREALPRNAEAKRNNNSTPKR